jgi:multidrug efflux pump subunit AcrB
LIAFFLIPVLASSAFQSVPRRSKEAWLTHAYCRLLSIALCFRKTVLLASVALLIVSIGLLRQVGVSFLPEDKTTFIALQVKLSSEYSIAQTDAVSRKIEQMIRSFPAITASQMTIDSEKEANPLWGEKQEKEAHFTLTVKKGTKIDPLLQQLQQKGEAIVHQTDRKGTFIAKEQVTEGPPTGNNLEINLYGNQAAALERAAQMVEQKLKAHPQLKNVENQWNEVRPVWNISLKEEAKKEVSSTQLSRALVERLQPIKVGDFHLDGQDQRIELVYDQGVKSRTQLEEVSVQTTAGWKPLHEIATIQQKKVPVSIKHQDGKKVAQVTATIKGKDVVRVTQVMQQPLSDEVEMQVGGGLEEIQEGFSNLGMAIIVAIGLVFLLLSSTFHGLKTPLLILSSLLFVPSGAILGILLAGQALTVSSLISLLMLVGIVVTNAIVLVDRIETNRDEGMDQLAAIQEAAKIRLRPILMTALATIFALLPLALTTNAKALISKDLAITVIGGLTTSTLLTLVVIPVLYAMFRKQKTTINFDLEQTRGTYDG